jgi:hypothetical protein
VRKRSRMVGTFMREATCKCQVSRDTVKFYPTSSPTEAYHAYRSLRWGMTAGWHGDYFEYFVYAGIWYFSFACSPVASISSPLTSNLARELTLEAAQSASTAKGPRTDYNSRGFDPSHIKKLLDSRSERDILDGMRRVISVCTEQLFPWYSYNRFLI